MRTLAIGDIHGCREPLIKLWEVIEPTTEDRIIFVGDYVDRGADTKHVIEFLININKTHNITFLTGNHEEKFFLAKHGRSELADWLAHWGGQQTLDSYGGMEAIPDTHWEFFRTTLPYLETENHIFVHANLEADVPVDEQIPYTIIHKKLGTPLPHQSGKTMICGHTAQASHVPLNLGHAICIDTDPGRGGWLTCLDVDNGNYWQTNMNSQVRTARL